MQLAEQGRIQVQSSVAAPSILWALSAPDWASVLNVFTSSDFSTFWSAVSALAAMASTMLALAALKSQAEERRYSIDSDLYRQVVLDQALQLIQSFAEGASVEIEECEGRLAQARREDVSLARAENLCQDSVEKLNRLYFALKLRLDSLLYGWGDDQLRGEITRLMEQLQDGFTAAIEAQTATGGTGQVRPMSSLFDGTSKLQRALLSYRPKQTVRSPTRAPVVRGPRQ